MPQQLLSFSPCRAGRPDSETPFDDNVFEEEPLADVVQPGPSMPLPVPEAVPRNVCRPKSVGELAEMVAHASARNYNGRRPIKLNRDETEPLADEKQKPMEHKTVVAFGRTTKLKDTIQGVKPTASASTRPLIGTAKEVECLKKIVETQQTQIEEQEQRIVALEAANEAQRVDYVSLLQMCDKLTINVARLDKKLSSVQSNASANTVPSTTDAMEPQQPTSNVYLARNAPVDSIALKKGETFDDAKTRHLKPVRENVVDADCSRGKAVALVGHRDPEREARRRRRKEELNQSMQSLRTLEHTTRRPNQTLRDENPRRNGMFDDEPLPQPGSGRFKEKLTFQREVLYSPGRNIDPPPLSTTIDSTLQRNMATRFLTQHRYRQENQRGGGVSPHVQELSESDEDIDQRVDDDWSEPDDTAPHPVSTIFAPKTADRRRRHHGEGRGTPDEAPLRRVAVTTAPHAKENNEPGVQYTVMPDVFDDDDDFDQIKTPCVDEQHQGRQKVAQRWQQNLRN